MHCRYYGFKTTHRVGRGVLLLSRKDAASSLSSVESRLAADDSLARTTTGASDAATDLGGGIPVVRHCDGSCLGCCGGVDSVR